MFLQIAREHLSRHPAEAAAQCEALLVLHDDDDSGRLCELSAVQQLTKASVPNNATPPAVFDVDHEYPGGDAAAPLAVLYADLDSASFAAWHAALLGLHEAGTLRYVLRHRRAPSMPAQPPLRLSGYGVELAVKKMEYIATDDTAVADDASSAAAAVADDDEGAHDLAGFDFAM